MKSELNPQASGEPGTPGAPVPGAETDLGALLSIVELRHPHLLAMHPLPGRLGFEPDMAGGERLSRICRLKYASRPIPLRFGLRILLDVLSGLAALHGAKRNRGPLGFRHGELAPCNIVIGRDGLARLIPVVNAHFDKGALPNPEASGYAAPEKLRGDPFDQRADTFSAGVMLWEMITGRSFRGLPAEVITAWVVDGIVPDPLQPEDAPWVVSLAAVATTALDVDPTRRWSHVGLMGAEIEAIVDAHMASPSEIARLLADDGDAPTREPVHTPAPPAPSLPPTSMSIPPPLPPVVPAPVVAAPVLSASAHTNGARARDTLSYEHAPMSPSPFQAAPLPEVSAAPTSPTTTGNRMGSKVRTQPLIAWATMGVALVLLAVAAHELFSNPPPRRAESVPAQPAIVPAPTSPVVTPPDPERGSVGGAATSQVTDRARFEPPPLPSAAASAANPAASMQPGAKPAPHGKAPPSPPRKGPKRDEQFGI